MASHNDIGKKGEDLACQMLMNQGYVILERNWRYLRAEIDIIAQNKTELIFVEVKTRTNISHGPPDGFLSKAQELRLFDAANAYIDELDHHGEIRFDIIAIHYLSEHQVSTKHFKDAFLND